MTDKNIESIFFQFHSSFTKDSNSKNNNSQGFEVINLYGGMCKNRKKFLKE